MLSLMLFSHLALQALTTVTLFLQVFLTPTSIFFSMFKTMLPISFSIRKLIITKPQVYLS